MRTLALDSSGSVITVGTAENSHAIARHDVRAERGRGNLLEQVIDDVLAESCWSRNDVDGLGVVLGPGSLTAIRIAWATVTGWAQSAGIPATGWSVPRVHQRKLGDDAQRAVCCTHFRGDTFLLYELSNLEAPPDTVQLNGEAHSKRPPAILTGPGILGRRAHWEAYFGSATRIVADTEAYVGGDLLAIWTEADLMQGRALSTDSSPLEYGLPPDFKKLPPS
jgi:tRNA threonylcarbamoyl adenosine modification protein YeaZ